MNEHLMNNYARLPIAFSHGEGVWITDQDGKTYLDALSGIGVCSLGHAHPAVTEAVCAQAGRLTHTSNLYGVPAQSDLADRLCRLSGMDRVFFSNSGAEANEAAIKIARLYGHAKGIELPVILVTENSFHGRTMATLSATGNRKIQAGFEPLVRGFARIPFGDIAAIEAAANNNRDIVGILVEPVQGEGGVRIPEPGYLREVRQICDRHGWLMMLDEVQTGIGRTGRWFAFQHDDILPDVMALAKALANGVPIGACLARGAAADVFRPGHHGTTFGGNPLACSAALATLKTIENEGLVTHAEEMGRYLLDALRAALSAHPRIKDIRGRGLMIGIELHDGDGTLPALGLGRGLLFSLQAGNVIRLLPPLILSRDEADEIVLRLTQVIEDLERSTASA
ncbi:MAG: acetylornithine transaminase [Gammaproteobacteria bacterium]|nr:acetylornithine transaminase [Gammaproteobacteria bacterium]